MPVRIIAGSWRGRKLVFPDLATLRPTPDRLRETLFNWLSPSIQNTRCLDLCAGSGALGFEALSRGADHVDFVDNNSAATQAIKANAEKLRADNLQIITQDVGKYLQNNINTVDIIFFDPPYQSTNIQDLIKLLPKAQWLVLETHKTKDFDLPTHWQLHRTTKAGNAKINLYHYQNNPES